MKHHMRKRDTVSNSEIDSKLKFKVSESYKVVRTNIIFSVLKQECKKIVISSSLAGEGKTTTAVHVAISLSQMNLRTLLIDADLRKPNINQYFNLDNAPGLMNYIGHMSEMENIIHKTEYPNLSVICAGVIIPNPSELLASNEMALFLNELDNQFDYIVVDTPPLNVVIDALPLIKLSDGVILVVRENSSTYPELNKTLKNLKMVDAKILGLILNSTKERNKGSYQYHYGEYEAYGS